MSDGGDLIVKLNPKSKPPIYDRDAIVEADVQKILAGKRYPPRGYTEEIRIPEDISTGIALSKYGVDAYDGNKYGKKTRRDLAAYGEHVEGLEGSLPVKQQPPQEHEYTTSEDDTDALVEADVQAILAGKRYPLRGNTEEFRIPEDISTQIALEKYGVDTYEGHRGDDD